MPRTLLPPHPPPHPFCQIKTDMAARGKVRRKLTETWATNRQWQVLRGVVIFEVIVCYLREGEEEDLRQGWRDGGRKTTRVKKKKQRQGKGKSHLRGWQHAEHAAQGHTEPTCMQPTALYIEPRGQISTHVRAHYKATPVMSPMWVTLINLVYVVAAITDGDQPHMSLISHVGAKDTCGDSIRWHWSTHQRNQHQGGNWH